MNYVKLKFLIILQFFLTTLDFCFPKMGSDTHLDNIFADFRPQKVVNLAAQAGVRYSIENPLAYIKSNIVGFGNLLENLVPIIEILSVYVPSFSSNEKVQWRVLRTPTTSTLMVVPSRAWI